MLTALMALFCMTACSPDTVQKVEIKGADRDFDLSPCQKENGERFCIAVIDEAPPIESSYLWLRGIAEEFVEMGYINSGIDLSEAPEDFDGLYSFLSENDLGDNICFDSEYYLVGGDDDDTVAEKLKTKAEDGKIDVIAATGTRPGQFLKELGLDIPFLVSMATDPVASGIIDSVEDSGDDNIWALVEPNPAGRQLGAYSEMFGIKTLGILTVDEYEEIAAIPEYEQKAKELGITVKKESISLSDYDDPDFCNIVTEKVNRLCDEGIDSFLLAYFVLDDQPEILTDLLAEKGIPYLISDGDSLVERGGLICLSCYDYSGYGSYAAMVMSNIFHGSKAGDQPSVYTSTVHIALNLTTAEKTGIKTDFELLRSADKIYR